MVRRSEIGDMAVFDSSPQSSYRVLREKIDSRVAGSWWQGYHNSKVNMLLDSAATTPALDERAKLYSQCARLLSEDPPWLTLYHHTRSYAVSKRGADIHFQPAFRRDSIMDFRRAG